MTPEEMYRAARAAGKCPRDAVAEVFETIPGADFHEVCALSWREENRKGMRWRRYDHSDREE